MFDVGFTELLLVFAIGLLILGPERLPGVIKSVTYWSRKARASIDEAKSQITKELHIDEMAKNIGNYNDHLKSINKSISTSSDIDAVNESISNYVSGSTEDTKATTGKKNTRSKRSVAVNKVVANKQTSSKVVATKKNTATATEKGKTTKIARKRSSTKTGKAVATR